MTHFPNAIPVACLLLTHESKKEKPITLFIYLFLFIFANSRVHDCGRTDVRAGRQVRASVYMILCKLNKWKCFGIQCTHHCTMRVLFFTQVWRGNFVVYLHGDIYALLCYWWCISSLKCVHRKLCVRRWWYYTRIR